MIFGSVINENLKDEIVVTVIATGFQDSEDQRSAQGTRGGGRQTVSRQQPTRQQAPQQPQQSAPQQDWKEEPVSENEPSRDRDGQEEDEGLDIPTFLRNRRRR
jgi:cell division protein FtsZ